MKKFIIIGSLCTLSACGPNQPANTYDPITVEENENIKPILFSKVRFDLPRRSKLGDVRYDLFCVMKNEWRDLNGGYIDFEKEDFKQTFTDALYQYGYPVVNKEENLFADEERYMKAEVEVGAKIKALKVDLCHPNEISEFSYSLRELASTEAMGDAEVEVEWNAYSTLDDKLIYKTKTKGKAKYNTPEAHGATNVVLDAFSDATEGLIADKKFVKLLKHGKGKSYYREEKFEEIGISIKEKFKTSLKDNINEINKSVITIMPKRGAHGSGFIISSYGYALTNQHVIGEADTVRVKMDSGKIELADVIRSHKHRDVALIQIRNFNPKYYLPLNMERLGIGEEVYALGTPKYKKLNNTLSKGIISAYRYQDKPKQLYIQSDTAVSHGSSGGPMLDENGNVIGLTVAGYEKGQNLNLFIPIYDALDKLGITIDTIN